MPKTMGRPSRRTGKLLKRELGQMRTVWACPFLVRTAGSLISSPIDLTPREVPDFIFTSASQDEQFQHATEVVIRRKRPPDGCKLLLSQHAIALAAVRHGGLHRADHRVVSQRPMPIAQANRDDRFERTRSDVVGPDFFFAVFQNRSDILQRDLADGHVVQRFAVVAAASDTARCAHSCSRETHQPRSPPASSLGSDQRWAANVSPGRCLRPALSAAGSSPKPTRREDRLRRRGRELARVRVDTGRADGHATVLLAELVLHDVVARATLADAETKAGEVVVPRDEVGLAASVDLADGCRG